MVDLNKRLTCNKRDEGTNSCDYDTTQETSEEKRSRRRCLREVNRVVTVFTILFGKERPLFTLIRAFPKYAYPELGTSLVGIERVFLGVVKCGLFFFFGC